MSRLKWRKKLVAAKYEPSLCGDAEFQDSYGDLVHFEFWSDGDAAISVRGNSVIISRDAAIELARAILKNAGVE